MKLYRATSGNAAGLLSILVLLCSWACDDPGSPGVVGPGVFRVELTSPNGAEGSAVFELATSASLGVVSSSVGEVYYEHNYGLETSRVIVIMDQPGQVGFRVHAGEVGDVPEVTLLQVADGSDQLRSSLSGYHVEVAAVPDGGSE